MVTLSGRNHCYVQKDIRKEKDWSELKPFISSEIVSDLLKTRHWTCKLWKIRNLKRVVWYVWPCLYMVHMKKSCESFSCLSVSEYYSLVCPVRQYSQFAVRLYSFHQALLLEVLWFLNKAPQIVSVWNSLNLPKTKIVTLLKKQYNPQNKKKMKQLGRWITICSMIGPESSSSVTKWVVAPISFTPASNAYQQNLKYE